MRFLFKILFIIFIFFLSTNKIFAQIIITELYPNPSTGESEWIEIYNQSEEEVHLLNWRLEDTLTNPSIIKEFNEEIIGPNNHLVINLTQNKLNNSGDTVKLVNPIDVVVDQFSYQNSISAQSFSKQYSQTTGYITDIELTQATPNDYPISTLPNPSVSPTYNPTQEPVIAINKDLTITKFIACPDKDESEQVEILNNEDHEVSLYLWSIIDGNSNQIFFPENEIISPGETKILSWERSLLNNTGDNIYLKDGEENTIDHLEYKDCTAGKISNQTKQDSEEIVNNDLETNKEISKNILPEVNLKAERIKKINSLLEQPHLDKVIDIIAPLSNRGEFVIMEKEGSRSGIISVILGGSLLLISGLILFYETTENNN